MFVKMPKEMRLRSQTKEASANVYNYFKELNKRKRTQGSLKQTSDESNDSDQSASSDDE